MKNNTKSFIAASIVTTIFILAGIGPGIINMLGYTILLAIFGDNSYETVKYEKLIIYSFDILCILIVFWLTYKIVNKILQLKNQ